MSKEWIKIDCYENDGYYFDLGYWAKSLNLTVDDVMYCDSIYKLDKNTRYVTTEDVYTKTESDEKYVLKNEPIEMTATYNNDTYPITISGNQTYLSDYIKFVADKDYDNIQFTINYQKGTDYGLIFRCNGTDLMRLNNIDKSTIVNTIKNMDGVEYVLKTELDEYVATETLEDVVSQINSKFDSQKRRWTFKLTMNANSNTATINLSESIDDYNPVLSNSDGHHVFTYQETNEALEIIVLTVTLSGITLSVQADKPSKNNYEVYLSFDEL